MTALQPHVVDMQGKRVLLLNNYIESGVLPEPQLADIWLVDHKDRTKIKSFLRAVVRSSDVRVYLMPIFLDDAIGTYIEEDTLVIQRLCDGYWGEVDALKAALLCEHITDFIRQRGIAEMTFASQHERILQYIFDYMYTRAKSLLPIRQHQSLTGYAYPRIDSFFFNRKDAYLHSRQILKQAEEEGYLKRKYFDTQHLCKTCSSGFLNYHEVCPKCGEHDLKATNLIHHFRCAYLGPETDFAAHHKLICPKCAVELRNIGVDYDRPGKMFTCKSQSCGHKFQEAPIQVCCVDCGTAQAPYELVVKKVYQYDLAEAGVAKFIRTTQHAITNH